MKTAELIEAPAPAPPPARAPSVPKRRPGRQRRRKGAGIGAAMAGGNPRRGRKKLDFYETPPDVTVALARRLGLRGTVWEPCVETGSIADVLISLGIEVVGTDVVDRNGRWLGGQDVLQAASLRAPSIVTNPPFSIAAAIVERLLALEPDVLALLLKSTFWQAARRLPLFRERPPSHVLALSWRPDFEDLGGPTMEVSWMVWRKGHAGPTTFDVLERPEEFRLPRRGKQQL